MKLHLAIVAWLLVSLHAGEKEDRLQSLLNAGRDAEALPLARALAEKAPTGRESAEARHALGYIQFRLCDYARAAETLRLALQEFDKAGAEAEKLGSVADAAALALQQAGNSREAERLFHRALDERERAFPGRPEPWTNTTRAQLAKLLLTRGRIDEARELLAIAVPESLRPDGEITPSMAAQRWQTLADFHQATGNYAEAARCLGLALEHGGENTALRNNLGMAFLRSGKNEDARREIEAAYDAAPLADRTAIANNLAVLWMQMGKPERALEYFVKGSPGRTKRDASDIVRLGNFASAAHAANDLARAATASRESIALAKRFLPVQHPLRAQLFLGAAAIAQDTGDAEGSRRLARESSASARGWLAEMNGVGSGEEMLAFRTTSDAISPLAAFAPEETNALADAVLATKGAALEQSLRLHRLGNEKEIAIREAFSALENATRQHGPSSPEAASVRRKMTALPKPPKLIATTWQSVTEKLPDDAVYVDFVRWKAHLGNDRWEPRYSALVLRKNAQPVWLSLGRAEVIDRSIQDFLTLAERLNGQAQPDAATPLPLATLWDLLWAPLEKETASARRIILRPDGMLHLAPWAVLTDAESGKFLCQRFPDVQIVAAPRPARALEKSNGEWAILTVPDAPSKAPPARIAAPMDAELWSKLKAMPALPGTERECAAIQSVAGRETRVIHAATQVGLRTVAAQKPAVLHIASHAFSLSPAAEERWTPYRTGLVFSDGVLFSAEAATLPLEKTRLVLLSACFTGAGTPEPGEHINGLRRAFLIAGAHRVVSTLWSVRDDSAAPFMAGLYPGIASESGALWSAQRNWLEGRSNSAASQSQRLRILTAGAWIAESDGWE